MKIAVCDDEVSVLEDLATHINEYCNQRRTSLDIFAFSSAGSLNSALDNGQSFDIFLLDVYIGKEMGTELARDIRAKGIESPIMFLTTSIEHAPESFESGTLRYLIKPLNIEKLFEALDVAISKSEKLNTKLIKLKTDNGIESINASQIMFTESHGHYQYLNLSDGLQLRVRMTVAELFDVLNSYGNFVKCGSAYIVNMRKIKTVSSDKIILLNGEIIHIPRGNYTAIKKAFWELQYEEQGD